MAQIPDGVYAAIPFQVVEGRAYTLVIRLPGVERSLACGQVAAWLRTLRPELLQDYYGLMIQGRDDNGTIEVRVAGLGDCPAVHRFVYEVLDRAPWAIEDLGWLPQDMKVYEYTPGNNDDEDDGA